MAYFTFGERQYEKPASLNRGPITVHHVMDDALPIAAHFRGYHLLDVRLVERLKVDPVCLYSPEGKILREWQYPPSLSEVDEVIAAHMMM